MLEIEQTSDDGFIFTLKEFRDVLLNISNETRMWWVYDLSEVEYPHVDLDYPHILVGYRDKEDPDLVNDISFALPVLSQGDSYSSRVGSGGNEDAEGNGPSGPCIPSPVREDPNVVLICVAPGALEIGLRGVYWTENRLLLRHDSLADFECFWPPLRDAILATLNAVLSEGG